MDEGLKQRLIGALVLLALGVIFLPVLFAPDHRRSVDRSSQIPPAPGIESIVIAEPVKRQDIEPAPAPQSMYAAGEEAEAAAATPPEEPVQPQPQIQPARDILDAKGVAKAWAVQVGSFSEPDRAFTLRDQLLGAGYPSYARTSTKLTRVYVGPKIDYQKAVQLKAELDRSLKLDTLVVKFSP